MTSNVLARGCAISLAAALTGGTAIAAAQLLNPSFEEPGGDGSLWISDRAARWERWGGWFNRETTWSPVHDGQCIMAYHHWKIQGDETAGIYQDIANLPPGQKFTFSVEIIKDKFTNADFVELRLEPYLGGKTLASRVYRMNDLKSAKWTTLTVTGSSPTAGIRTLVVVKPGRNTTRKGALKFDAARLAPAAVDAVPDTVVDPWSSSQMCSPIRRKR